MKTVASASWSHTIITLSGSCAALFGVLVLFGWYAHELALVQPLPRDVPVYHNVALGFFLCGLGLLAVAGGWWAVAYVSGGLAGLLGFATLTQYLYGVDLGIDERFVKDFSGFPNPYPGRMAPTTALGLTLAGIALIMADYRTSAPAAPPDGSPLAAKESGPRIPLRIALLTLLGAVVFLSGLMTSILYVTDMMVAHGWGQVVNMHPYTALSLLTLGAGLLATAWRERQIEQLAVSLWLPGLAGVATVTITLLLCHALLAREHTHIEQTVTTVIRAIQLEVRTRMDARLLALLWMAQRWEYQGAPAQSQWEFEAAVNLRHFPDCRAIVWIDPQGQVRWVASQGGVQTFPYLRAAFEDQRRGLAAGADRHRATVVTDLEDPVLGKTGFAVFAPVAVGGQFSGFIVGVFTLHGLLHTTLRVIAPGYAVAVFEGAKEIYRYGAVGAGAAVEWGHEGVVDTYGVTWRVRVWPRDEVLAGEYSALPEVVFGIGLGAAGLLAWMTVLAQAARRRAREVAAAYLGLSQEVGRRTEAEARLRAQERLAAVGAAVAKLAHEIANPLNGMATTVQLLRRQLARLPQAPAAAALREGVDDIDRELARLHNLLADLRQVGRPPQLAPRPTDLRGEVEAVARLHVAPAAGPAVAVVQDFPPRLPPVRADPDKLQQVVLNLCKNALDAMPGGGTLTLRGSAAAAAVTLEVCDTGVGIPPGVDVFAPFVTTKAHGTGLGLAIVKQIIEAHGGTVSYASTPGRGTSFRLTLPAVSAAELSTHPGGDASE